MDVKTATSAVNARLNATLTRRAHHCQRGFVPSRQLAENIVEIGASMRIEGLGGSAPGAVGKTPLAVFLDFLAAFPSVAHRGIFAVLHAMELPRGLVVFMQ